MRTINKLIVHCADTPNGRKNTVEDIDAWHRKAGFLRSSVYRKAFNPSLYSIGYHYVVYPDGTVHTGRSESEVGAHARGHNAHSIGICLLGKDKFTQAQWDSLKRLLEQKQREYPEAVILGHYEVDAYGKTCPNFDVQEYVRKGFVPEGKHVL